MLKISRELLLNSALGDAEVLICRNLGRQPTPEVQSPLPQLLFTLRGCFLWHVGSSRQLVDANRCVVIHAGETSQDSHPTDAGDVAALLITPRWELIEEIFAWDGGAAASAGAMRVHTLPATPALQLATHDFVNAARRRRAGPRSAADELALEEDMLAVLRRLAPARRSHPSLQRTRVSGRVRRMVHTVKEQLQALDQRVSLTELARTVNVTPAHLTDVFRRVEGIPLANYCRRIRLARALHELPRTQNLASLAQDLGFSSHGHFSAAFKSLYGITPSQFRDSRRVRSA